VEKGINNLQDIQNLDIFINVNKTKEANQMTNNATKTIKIYLSKATRGYWIASNPGHTYIEEGQIIASFSPQAESENWENLPCREVEISKEYDLAESTFGEYFLYNAAGSRLDVAATKKGEIYFL
jgi:hypothetical protein